MPARRFTTLLSLMVVLLLLTLSRNATTPAAARTAPPGGPAPAPLLFVENEGQFDPRARYQARVSGGTLWLAQDALWLTLVPGAAGTVAPRGMPFDDSTAQSATGAHVRLSFPGATRAPRIEPFDRLETAVNYLTGSDPRAWRQEVPAWGGVRYVDLYPGIDLELSGEGGALRPRFVVREGATLDEVRLRFEGVEGTALVERDGEPYGIQLAAAGTEVVFPLLEVVDAAGREVERTDAPSLEGNEISRPFTQRPAALAPEGAGLVYSTFLGGNVDETAYDIEVDGSGNSYLVGATTSTTFPTTPGAFDTAANGEPDLFVTKLNAAGTGLIYSTYLGGSDEEEGYGIAIDSSGHAYVSGYTYSSNFPTTPGAYDTTFNGSYDSFVAKLNPAGNGLVYSTFLGGTSTDLNNAIAVDGAGRATITGRTTSASFPTTAGAFDTTYNGLYDAFVTRFSPDGATLVYSTFLGAPADDIGYAIAVEPGGEAYIAGGTFSAAFPTTPGAFDTTFNGYVDIFATRLNAAGSALLHSTLIGGGAIDVAVGMALDGGGSAYLTGYTQSAAFPTSPGAYDTTHGGVYDVFVTKVNPSGSQLSYSTYLGGEDEDAAYGIVLDSWQNAYIAGESASAGFPTTAGAYDTTYDGLEDAVLTVVNADGSALLYSSYLGTIYEEVARDIALDSAGSPYLAGWVNGPAFPTTAGAYDTTHNGWDDAFVTKFEVIVPPGPSPTATATIIPGTPTATVPSGFGLYLPLVTK